MTDRREDWEPEWAEPQDEPMPERLPILPLRGCVAYPGLVMPLAVGRPSSIRLIEDAVAKDGWIGMAALMDGEIEEPRFDDLYGVGTAGRITRMWKAEDGTIQMLVRVGERIKLTNPVSETPWVVSEVEAWPEAPASDSEAEQELLRRVLSEYQGMTGAGPQLAGELFTALSGPEEVKELLYLVASSMPLPVDWRQALLEAEPFKMKLEMVLEKLLAELEVAKVGAQLQERVLENVNKQNREFFLREQMRLIQEELDEAEEEEGPLVELERKLASGVMPREAELEAKRELKRLKQIPPGSPEYGMIHGYLEWLGRVPWGATSGHVPDLAAAREILEKDHAGLEKVKERLMEYLAVRRLRAQRGMPHDDARVREPILCLVGPPGVGKTSLGRSVARALGRQFVRVSLGGVHDEAAIRGHRRTYIGAMPGRIIQALTRAGTSDPVIMLDELDKVGADYRGDPASALLELLDPEQNHSFRDHYLDVPCDLSRAIFIATANTLDSIPAALRDRLEILQLAGYTEDEKSQIARRFLLPRQLTSHGLAPSEFTLEEVALRKLIGDYTREAGVRELERHMAALVRKAAVEVAEHDGAVTVHDRDLKRLLGPARHENEVTERIDRPGIATGLVWTPVGGDILFVEAAVLPGTKGLKLTGQLGEVMRESAEAALAVVRSRANQLGLPARFFERVDLHVHVPGGAIPKDGPSAGITLATALASALTGRPVRDDLAMTGEITLRGKVLPVGGIKEKVLGARRAGLQTVILPKRNEQDLEELPAELRRQMTFVLVDSVDEVLAHVFATDKQAQTPDVSLMPPVWYIDKRSHTHQGGAEP